MYKTMVTVTSSIIIGAFLVKFLYPAPEVKQSSPAEVGHLTTISAGLVHRERALLEILNKKGYLTANEVTKVRQMV